MDVCVKLAQAFGLNPRLHDDDIAKRVGLQSPKTRARQVSLLLDGYGWSRAERVGFVDEMVSFAVHDAADQAAQAGVAMETKDASSLWAIAWRTRGASWMLRYRRVLENALSGS